MTKPDADRTTTTTSRTRRAIKAAIIGAIAFVPGEALAADTVDFAASLHVLNDTTGDFDAAVADSYTAIGSIEHEVASLNQVSSGAVLVPTEPFVAITLDDEGLVVLVPTADIVIDHDTQTVTIFPSEPLTSVPEEWTQASPFGGFLLPLLPLAPVYVPEEWTFVPEEWTWSPFGTTAPVPEEWTRDLTAVVPEEWTFFDPAVFGADASLLID